MAKEVLLYGHINEISSAKFIEDIEATQGEDLVVRVNTGGGSPEYGWGMVAKFREHEGGKRVRVDGKAHSTGLLFVTYAKDVEAHDFSQLLVHRAAYPQWFEADDMYFTAALRENLENVNKSFRKAFEAKIDVKKFEELKGVKIKDLFSMEGRLDVFLTAKEAEQIGLISKVISVKPEARAELMAMYEMEAHHAPTKHNKGIVKTTKNDKKMTLEELQAQHPALYAQVVGLGVTQGVAKEVDRAGAWMLFAEVDPKAVAEGISSGKPLSMTQQTELMMKKIGSSTATALEAEAAAALETPNSETPDSAKPASDGKKPEDGKKTETEEIEAKMMAELGIELPNTKK